MSTGSSRASRPVLTLSILLLLGLDSCTVVEWHRVTEADEALAACRRSATDRSTCQREEAEAQQRQREYDEAVASSACYRQISRDDEGTTPYERYD